VKKQSLEATMTETPSTPVSRFQLSVDLILEKLAAESRTVSF